MSEVIVMAASRDLLMFRGVNYPGSCIVRTYESAQWCRRNLHIPSQVHYSSNADGSDGKPVMPAVFPSGLWDVTDVVDNDQEKRPDLGPVIVKTNAHRTLYVWALDENGGYDHVTQETIEDYLYEIHSDEYKPDGGFSVGCFHVVSDVMQLKFADAVRDALKYGPVQVNAL